MPAHRRAGASGENCRGPYRGERGKHEVAAIKAFLGWSDTIRPLSLWKATLVQRHACIGSQNPARLQTTGMPLNSQGCMISAGTMSTMGEVCAFVASVDSVP